MRGWIVGRTGDHRIFFEKNIVAINQFTIETSTRTFSESDKILYMIKIEQNCDITATETGKIIKFKAKRVYKG